MATSDNPDSSSRRSDQNFQTFILPSEAPAPVRDLHGKGAVFFALGANLTIGTLKLIAGFFGNQSSLFSEAMHSYADGINSGFLLIGLQKGSRAADKTHPFGYGLETTLWAMLASMVMLILACLSMYLGIRRFMQHEAIGNYTWSAMVLVVSMYLEIRSVGVAATAVLNESDTQVKGFINRFIAASKQVRHTISPTTRFVFYEDTIALTGALIAFIAITLSQMATKIGWMPSSYTYLPDACASFIIGLMLLGLAFYLFLHNSRGLTGSSAGPQVEQRIREFVLSLNGVSQIHDLRTINYGISGVVVQMRLEVSPDILVKDVDDLTERIRDRIQARVKNVKEVIIEVLADETHQEWSEQFYRLIENGRQTNVLKPREESILRNVFDFTHVVVSDIMVPRTDVECVEASATVEALIDLVIESGHTRIPVYKDDVDDMLGAIHVKDLFEVYRQGALETPLATLVRPFDVYPENKPVSDLLEEFKRKKIQMAIVIDEHGGFAGIVTLEDLLEEIVGELWDEYDHDPAMLEQPEASRLIVNGRFEIDALNESFRLGIPEEEFKTLGGFVFGLLGREPAEGDAVLFEDMTFTVLKMDGHRIEQIQIESADGFVQHESHED